MAGGGPAGGPAGGRPDVAVGGRLATYSHPMSSRSSSGPLTTVLTQEQQAALKPAAVIADLRAGNERYASGRLTERNHLAQLPLAAAGQFPKAAVVSCVDSRVPVETVFDCGIGDLFVARVAGNFVNPDILGSLEFACHVSGSKVVVVLGHEACGAVKAAVDGVELGNITEMLSKITPVVAATESPSGDRTSGNTEFVAQVTAANVRHTMARVVAESPILAEMVGQGSIAIVGAVYQLGTGRVTFLDGDTT